MKTGKNNSVVKIVFKSVKCPKGTNSLMTSGTTVISLMIFGAPIVVDATGRSTTLF